MLDIDLAAVLPAAAGSGPIRVAGNLPYNISSPILFRLLDLQSQRPVSDATLMLQREVADRIVARPGTAEYGVLSVLFSGGRRSPVCSRFLPVRFGRRPRSGRRSSG